MARPILPPNQRKKYVFKTFYYPVNPHYDLVWNFFESMLIEAGYTKATAKNPYIIFESETIKEGISDLMSSLEDKRKLAITYLTDKKLKKSQARELIYVIDILTKNIQLLGGKPTENKAFLIGNILDELENGTAK